MDDTRNAYTIITGPYLLRSALNLPSAMERCKTKEIKRTRKLQNKKLKRKKEKIEGDTNLSLDFFPRFQT